MKSIIINLIILFVLAACSPTEIKGCLDQNADNFNPNASLSNNSCSYSDFDLIIEETGISTIIIFLDSITGLVVGDEIAVYDINGVVATVDSVETIEYGEIMVGVSDWLATSNNQGVVTTIEAIESEDLSALSGPILNGAQSGNEIIFKVWKVSENKVYSAIPTYSDGNGLFGEVLGIQVVSELDLLNP